MPTESHKNWARIVASVTEGTPSVSKWFDERETTSLDILSIKGDGKVCASIGLMDVDHNPPTELLMDSTDETIKLENLISMASFFIVKNGWKVKPGAVFEDLVKEYHPELSLKHLLFLPQFRWGETLSRVDLCDRTIYPLLVIGITDSELNYIRNNGLEELERIWLKNNVDVFNWHRGTCI